MDAVRRLGPDVSLDHIAELAEVSKPVFYAEFGDKTGLVDAMAVVLAGGVERTVLARVAAELSPVTASQPVTAGWPGTATRPAADRVIGAVIDALINLIDDEPNLYAYIVRSLRMRDRSLLDNALVRVIHNRATLIIGWLVIGQLADELPGDELDVLTDGVFGFVFGVVESWVATRRPPKDQLVEMVTAVIGAGLAEAATRRRI
jgi:AcrR family transcriptional regulator